MSNALSVNDELCARGMKVDIRCQRCGFEGESINHMLFVCPGARLIWASVGYPFPPRGFENRGLQENFDYLMNLSKHRDVPEDVARIFPWVLWIIWKNRNSFLFEGKVFDTEDTVAKIQEDARQWFEVHKPLLDNQESRKRIIKGSCNRRAPAGDYLKCNVGVSWSRGKAMAGTAWTARNNLGEVCCTVGGLSLAFCL